jgi:TIR domain
MAPLAQLPKLIGFFSYSRNDDEGDDGAVLALANRIYRELRSQLGRTDADFKLWRDKDALSAGEQWREKLKEAVSESVFFIQMVTPSVVKSNFCRFEFDSFIEREKELGRDDLVFPILYISVPELDAKPATTDPVISIVKDRQYVDWRPIRYLDINSTDVRQTVGQFCSTISRKLRAPWISPDERRAIEAQRQAEEQRRLQEAESQRRAEEEERIRDNEAKKLAEEERARKEAEQAELKRREKEERERREQELRELQARRKAEAGPNLLSRAAAIWSNLWSPRNQTAVTAITAPSAVHIAIRDTSSIYLLTVIGLAAFALGMLAEFLQMSGHYFFYFVERTHGAYTIISEKTILFSIMICGLLYVFGRIPTVVLLISFVVINIGRVIGCSYFRSDFWSLRLHLSSRCKPHRIRLMVRNILRCDLFLLLNSESRTAKLEGNLGRVCDRSHMLPRVWRS